VKLPLAAAKVTLQNAMRSAGETNVSLARLPRRRDGLPGAVVQ
jgi:hypothetical protein